MDDATEIRGNIDALRLYMEAFELRDRLRNAYERTARRDVKRASRLLRICGRARTRYVRRGRALYDKMHKDRA